MTKELEAAIERNLGQQIDDDGVVKSINEALSAIAGYGAYHGKDGIPQAVDAIKCIDDKLCTINVGIACLTVAVERVARALEARK